MCVHEPYHGWTIASDAVSTALSDNPLAEETRPDWVHPVDAPNPAAVCIAAQGSLFSSAGGSGLSARIGCEVFDIIADEGLQGNAVAIGERFAAGLPPSPRSTR